MNKKITACALAAAMAVSMAGCGEKSVDYSVEDDAKQTNSATTGDSMGGLTWKLGVPESCDETFDGGDAGVSVIKCVDDDIEIPDTASVKTIYYETNTYDSDAVLKLAESVLDDASGVYARDEDIYTEDEIQRNIDYLESRKEEASKNGDAEDVETYEGAIEEWQNKLDSAVDSVPADVSCTGYGTYYGTRNGHTYMLMVFNTESSGEMGMTISYTYDDSEKQKLLDEVENSTYTTCGMADIDIDYDTTDLENVCTVSEDEALATAMNFISDMGVSGLTAVLTKPAIREWYNEDESIDTPIDAQKDGYGFYFVRQIDGVGIADIGVSYTDNLSINQETSFYIYPAADYMYVYVNDSGIVEAHGNIYVDSSSITEGGESELLSWDDMLTAANESIAAYYKKYPTQYSEIDFNSLRLCYLATADDDGQKSFIPVWEFIQSTDTETVMTNGSNVEQAVYIDARDGSYIDVVENAKKLKTYEEF